MTSIISEVLWVKWLLKDLKINIYTPITMFLWQSGDTSHYQNFGLPWSTNHVEIDCFFIRERVASKEAMLMQINSKMPVTTCWRKALEQTSFSFLLGNIRIKNLHAPSWWWVYDNIYLIWSYHFLSFPIIQPICSANTF